jgi:hypothetical protein
MKVVRFPESERIGDDPKPSEPAKVKDRRRQRRSLVVVSFRTTEEREEKIKQVATQLDLHPSVFIDNILSQALKPEPKGLRLINREELTEELVLKLYRLWRAA